MKLRILLISFVCLVWNQANAEFGRDGKQAGICYLGYSTLHLGEERVRHFRTEVPIVLDVDEKRYDGKPVFLMKGKEKSVPLAQGIYVDFSYDVSAYWIDKAWRFGTEVEAVFYQWDLERGYKEAIVRGRASTGISLSSGRPGTSAELYLMENFKITQERLHPEFKSFEDSIRAGRLPDGVPFYLDIHCVLPI